MQQNILDQIFSVINHNGCLKDTLPNPTKLHPMARSVIEKALRNKNEETISEADLRLISSEISTASDGTLKELCMAYMNYGTILVEGLESLVDWCLETETDLPEFLNHDSLCGYYIKIGRTDMMTFRQMYAHGFIKEALEKFLEDKQNLSHWDANIIDAFEALQHPDFHHTVIRKPNFIGIYDKKNDFVDYLVFDNDEFLQVGLCCYDKIDQVIAENLCTS